MKTIKIVLAAVIMIMVSSCAPKMHFPVSDIAPAADITLTKKLDDHNNYEINLTEKTLLPLTGSLLTRTHTFSGS